METTLDGTVRAVDERFDVYFERHFDAPPERLWAAVSEPEPIPRFAEQDFFGMRERYAELIGPVQ